MTTLMIGTTIRRLNHLEYPAFEKMNQNGMMIRTTRIRQMTSPYIDIGIIFDMEFLLSNGCFSPVSYLPLLRVPKYHLLCKESQVLGSSRREECFEKHANHRNADYLNLIENIFIGLKPLAYGRIGLKDQPALLAPKVLCQSAF